MAKCKAEYVLVILDCCFAGGIGEKIASSEHIKPTVHVICACSASEASLPMTALENSFFSYFLLYATKKYQPKGQFVFWIKNKRCKLEEINSSFEDSWANSVGKQN